jgi:CheY-like chemotaxis protein
VAQRAHTLKGSAQALALPELVAAMERLEEAFRAQPPLREDAVAALAAAGGRGRREHGRRRRQPRPGPFSHELRTPLSVVLGFAHLLLLADLRPEERAHADAILQAAGQLAAIVDEAAGTPPASPRSPLSAARSRRPRPHDRPLSRGRRGRRPPRAAGAPGGGPPVRLVVARTGADGLAAAERERPDLVLLDLGLPDLAADEVMRRLRQGPGEAPRVVVVTGDARAERLRELRAAGASECLTKPVDLARLLAVVDSLHPG